MRFLRGLLAALAVLLPVTAHSQAILQGGTWTAGRAPMYVGTVGQPQTIVQDSGPASGLGTNVGLNELLLAIRGTGVGLPPYVNAGSGPLATNMCDYDGPLNSAAGYHYLCFSPNAQGGGLIAYGAGGGASPLPLFFNVNGTQTQLPTSGFGTVSSVGLAAPSYFTVSGSPVTTTGTLTLTANTQANNTFLAGPVSAGPSTPTFRTLNTADLPTVTNANLATMANGTVKANVSGSTTTPSDVTPSSILDTFSATQGTILFRGASSWSALAPGGSAGLVLSTGGPAANPSWIAASGSGTVTSVTCGTGLTGGTFTTTGTCALSSPVSIANGGTGAAITVSSGGIPYFSTSTTMASSAALTNHAIVLGGGAGAAPTALGSLGTSTTVLHGAAAGAPTFGAVALTTDVSGTLPATSGGTAQSTYATGDIVYASAANTLSKLGIGSTGNVLTVSGGVPTWGTGSSGVLVNIQVISATGTYTPTAGATTGYAVIVGGGGGGGGCQTAIGGGAGGGSGAETTLYIASLSSQSVTIGAAGTAGSGSGGDGGAGGQTSFGAVTAPGGTGGGGTSAGILLPGAGGVPGTGGTINRAGNNGTGPTTTGSTFLYSGGGASSVLGGGGLPRGAATGIAGTGFGSGGSGGGNNASTAHLGGAGAPGGVVVYEYK